MPVVRRFRPRHPNSHSGVALVITLIMLAVITVLAVAFLALSRRERSSVVHYANSIDAELTASAGAERAKAEILAYILTSSSNNGTAYATNWSLGLPGLMVSGMRTNLVRGPGDIPGFYGDPRDGVNDAADIAAISSLRVDAHPPVFIVTNRMFPANRDPRFYLDLNRNGRYDTNGVLDVLDATGNTIVGATGSPEVSLFTGDPEWFGLLSRPYEVHSRNNRFIGRYAFFILPAGLSLDVNYIHNQAKDLDMTAQQNGYFRNQGVGTWEINLAAFLADLNTNVWNSSGQDYIYNAGPISSRGAAFDDARELLGFRYNGNHRSLASASQMLQMLGQGLLLTNFPVDSIDAYSDGPFVPLGARPAPTLQADGDNPNKFWPGADSKKHVFSIHDFFDTRKTPGFTNFIDRLRSASTGMSSYDRYTFYRMLSQLSGESVAESENKIHINYKNDEGVSSTNFVSWQPLEFFTNVAHRLLRDEFPMVRADFGTNIDLFTTIHTNLLAKRIPVMIKGMTQFTNANGVIQRIYSPRIHQLLQVSANIYEATTMGKSDEKAPYFPTVFRPVFHYEQNPTATNIFIVDYIDETGPGFWKRFQNYRTNPSNNPQFRWHTLEDSSDWFSGAPTGNANFGTNDYFYGVPFIFGAKKGFPNFNEFAVATTATFSRKLQFLKDSEGDSRPKATNQMFIIGLSNAVAVEAWNSYDKPYPRDVRVVCGNVMGLALTNDVPWSYTPLATTNNGGSRGAEVVYKAGTWPGWNGANPASFQVPLLAQGLVLTDSVYRLTPVPHLEPIGMTNSFEPATASFTNHWGMSLTNKLLFFMFDDQYNYLIDMVSLANQSQFNFSDILDKPADPTRPILAQDQFLSQPQGGITRGAYYQIQVSMNQANSEDGDWTSYAQLINDKPNAIARFAQFMTGPTNTTNMQAPYTPVARIVQTVRWEANDPLVHYYPGDLETLDSAGNPIPLLKEPKRIKLTDNFTLTDQSYTTISNKNTRYRPWDPLRTGGDPYATDVRVKDSWITSSEFWDFPMQKFPNIGWLGRVHRGTPWQTVYLKGGVAKPEDWLEVQSQRGPGNSMETHPTNDWRLADLFTVALHPNATKGRLSVNQTNLAAWSAMLSSVVASKLHTPKPGESEVADQIIQPAALEPAVQQILEGILRERDSRATKRFERMSDILAVPELTVASPFLKAPYTDEREDPAQYLRDIDYERIPDQILSLLKLGEPRYVIYAFGQSLKPESIDPSSGVAINYQITGEVATRSVVRVEFEPQSTDPLDPNYLKPNVLRPHIVVEQFNILPPE